MKTADRDQKLSKLQLEAGEQVVVGIDVHKVSWHVALWSVRRGLLLHWVQPANAQSLIAILLPLEDHVKWVVYEAGPTGFGLARAVTEAKLSVWVVPPSRVPAMPGRDNKTDRLDCIKLAKAVASGQVEHRVCVPSEQEEADRQVVRAREDITRKLSKVKTQIKSFLLQHGIAEPKGLVHWTQPSLQCLRDLKMLPELRVCLDVLLDELKEHAIRLRRMTKQVTALSSTDRHAAAAKNLRTVPGVGLVTAMTVRTELIQPERFNDGGQVARMIGLAPSISQSGQTHRGGPIIKSGNGRIRRVLVEASWRGVRRDEFARSRYQRLLRNTGNSRKAIVGVARQRAICLWRILVTGKPYQPHATSLQLTN